MLWGKKEQYYLWYTAYLPLFLIMAYRFIDSLNLFGGIKLVRNIVTILNKVGLEFIVVVCIIIFSYVMYKVVIRWLINEEVSNLNSGASGSVFAIRSIKKLNVNDYTFFLMSLLLPLFSLDYESFINLAVSFLIIVVIIMIYVKTDFISVCPLFFTTGYQVYEAILSEFSKEVEKENPSVRVNAIIIIKNKNPDLNDSYRAIRLISNIYLVVKV
ncbi:MULTISPECIES: hypothetical protein [Bacillus]|uniref:hypothetical protein n=1 Tax=Bacillus TaxID=1386 RepID=UPI000BAE12C5|nr:MULTISPECIES: hypothetical protein [Bacillus]MCL8470498.1 hypothetical protein [Bacillus subtilis]MEC0361811.1 hypothetical protein [Bacillus subtilis]MEC1661026.1 hypothetical protein [Bacillus mojavensis]PAY13497.1 hypothetical protein CJU60_08920 [Bacillus sp. 7705b]UNM81006.1 hypothetical protein MNG38_14775 [Bacillus subtilis]